MIKKVIIAVIGTFLIFTNCVFAGQNISISFNGIMAQSGDYAPFIDENGRTMISIRWVADEWNLKVDWNEATQIATVHSGTELIKLQQNSNKILKGNTAIEMDTTPVLKNNRLFIPIRYLSQCLGFEVQWNKTTNKISVMQPERILFKDAYFGVLVPEDFNKKDYKTTKANFDNYSVVNFFDSYSGGMLFSILNFDLEEWTKEIKENFSTSYEVLYQNDKNILLCVSVSDVQYDPENMEQKKQYFKLLETKKQICDSLFILDD